MNAVNLTMLKALRAAGVDEALAEKAAAQIPAAEQLVTKADLEVALAKMELRLTVRLIGAMLVIATLAVAIDLPGVNPADTRPITPVIGLACQSLPAARGVC